MIALRVALTAVIALCAATLLGCGKLNSSSNDSTTASTNEQRILLRGNGPEPDSLDPQKARSNEAQQVLRDLYECLTSLGKDASVAPGVATSWEVTPNGLGWTFHLRPNAKWSNGDPVVAEDFITAFRRLVDPATASQYAGIIDVVLNANDIITGRRPPTSLGISALDEHTVVFDLNSPTPYLPSLFAHPSTCPVHRPTLAQYGNGFLSLIHI